MAGGNAAHYPVGNFFPTSLDAVGFVDRARGDSRLSNSSPYKRRGSDGKDVGVDFDALAAAMATTPHAGRPHSPRSPSAKAR